jgi:hypothetical protein
MERLVKNFEVFIMNSLKIVSIIFFLFFLLGLSFAADYGSIQLRSNANITGTSTSHLFTWVNGTGLQDPVMRSQMIAGDQIQLNKSGGTMIGALTVIAATSARNPATKQDTDAMNSTISGKPTAVLVTSIGNPGSDSNVVSEKAIETRSNLKANKSAETITGQWVIPVPTAATSPARQDTVTAANTSAALLYVAKGGATMTGALTVIAATSARNPATKQDTDAMNASLIAGLASNTANSWVAFSGTGGKTVKEIKVYTVNSIGTGAVQYFTHGLGKWPFFYAVALDINSTGPTCTYTGVNATKASAKVTLGAKYNLTAWAV